MTTEEALSGFSEFLASADWYLVSFFLVYNEPPYGTSFSSFSKFYTWCTLEIGNSEGQILKICLTYLFEVYTCWLHANCHICQISNFAIHTIWDTLYINLRYI